MKGPNDFLCIIMYLRAYTHVVCRTIDKLTFVKVNNQVIRPIQITQELIDRHSSEQFQESLSWAKTKLMILSIMKLIETSSPSKIQLYES